MAMRRAVGSSLAFLENAARLEHKKPSKSGRPLDLMRGAN
jgi:hypothetical protein